MLQKQRISLRIHYVTRNSSNSLAENGSVIQNWRQIAILNERLQSREENIKIDHARNNDLKINRRAWNPSTPVPQRFFGVGP